MDLEIVKSHIWERSSTLNQFCDGSAKVKVLQSARGFPTQWAIKIDSNSGYSISAHLLKKKKWQPVQHPSKLQRQGKDNNVEMWFFSHSISSCKSPACINWYFCPKSQNLQLQRAAQENRRDLNFPWQMYINFIQSLVVSISDKLQSWFIGH